MIFSESRTSQLTTHILDILWCRSKEVNCLEMWHWFAWLGNWINQLYQKYFFLKKLWLWIHNTHNTYLQKFEGKQCISLSTTTKNQIIQVPPSYYGMLICGFDEVKQNSLASCQYNPQVIALQAHNNIIT